MRSALSTGIASPMTARAHLGHINRDRSVARPHEAHVEQQRGTDLLDRLQPVAPPNEVLHDSGILPPGFDVDISDAHDPVVVERL